MSVAKPDAQSKNVSIADLQKVLLQEIHSPVLSSLDSNLYKRVASTIANLRSGEYDALHSSARDRLVDLLSTSVRSLIETRHRKIIQSMEELDYSKLTDEEKYLLDADKAIQKRSESIILACVNGRPNLLDSIAGLVRSKKVVVRFLKSAEQFMGIDFVKYGPFKEEDVATLPFENARPFIRAGIAIEVDSHLI